jgi:inorganic triphosphatase YgiF
LVEQEIKLAITEPERFDAVAAAPEITARTEGQMRTVPLDATYIDTAGLDLMRAGYAYRVRWEGDRWVATVKRAVSEAGEDGYHRHQEWEATVEAPEPDLSVFADADLSAGLAEAAGERALQALFRVRVERQVRDLVLEDGTRVEWAADRGQILAGEAAEDLCEVELELKAGEPESVQALARTLTQRYPLAPDTRTKYERGLRLAGLKDPA